jgi:hypothetical protein
LKNRKFHFQLRTLKDEKGESWSVSKIAHRIYVNRSRLNDVINDKPGHGGNTRAKVVKFLTQQFPEQVTSLLTALGWNEHGEIITGAVGQEASHLTKVST